MEPKHNLEHISPFKMGLFTLAWKTSSPHPACLEAQKMIGLCCQIALIYSAKSLSALAAVAFKNMSLITLCLFGLKRIYLPFLFSSWIRSNCLFFFFQLKWGSLVQRRLRSLRWKHDVFCVLVQPPHQLRHTYASGSLGGMKTWLFFQSPPINSPYSTDGVKQSVF